MKKTFFITIIVLLINSLCNSTIEPNNDIVFDVVIENMVHNYEFPKEGYYYEYQFESYKDHIPNVEEILRDFILNGVDLLDAWYQRGTSSCHPPNSQYAMTVIVEPNFLLRTKTQTNYLLANNFIQVENPPHFFCGYYVKHYIPRN